MIIKQVGNVKELVDLVFQRFLVFLIVIPQSHDRDPCAEVQILLAVAVIKMHASSVGENNGIPVVSLM